MHELLANIFEEHPGKTVYLSLGNVPRVSLDDGMFDVANESEEPLGPEKMAEIVNSLVAEYEGTRLKRLGFVDTKLTDEFYLRSISISRGSRSIDIVIKSRLLQEIEAENKRLEDTMQALGLIKGVF